MKGPLPLAFSCFFLGGMSWDPMGSNPPEVFSFPNENEAGGLQNKKNHGRMMASGKWMEIGCDMGQ